MGGCCSRDQSAKVHVTTAAATTASATTTTTASKYAIDGEGPALNIHQAAPPPTKQPPPSKQKGGKGDDNLEISNLADIPDEPSLKPPLPPEADITRSKPSPGKMTPTASAAPIEDELIPYEEEEEDEGEAEPRTAPASGRAEEPIKSAEDVLKGYSTQLKKKKKAKSSANLIYAPAEQLDSRDNLLDPKEGQPPPDLAATEGEAPKVFSKPF